MGRLGLLYVGQAPRPDYAGFFLNGMPAGTEIVEAGALDDLCEEEIAALPIREGEPVLTMRTRDMVIAVAPEAVAEARLPEKMRQIELRGAQVIVVVCTGEFPGLRSDGVLLKPSDELAKSALGIAGIRRVGVMVPLEEQIPQMEAKWRGTGVAPVFEAASPFGEACQIEDAALRLTERGADLVVLDCMGYTESMERTVARVSGKVTLAARTVVRRSACEILKGWNASHRV